MCLEKWIRLGRINSPKLSLLLVLKQFSFEKLSDKENFNKHICSYDVHMFMHMVQLTNSWQSYSNNELNNRAYLWKDLKGQRMHIMKVKHKQTCIGHIILW